MSTRKKFFLIGGLVFLVLLLLLCCCVFFYWFFNISLTSITDTQLLEQGDSSQVVAVIDVKDIITSTPTTDFWGTQTPDMVTRITEKIKRAAEDDNVKAVIFRIDSPGGEVYATKQIYNEILELKNKGKTVDQIKKLADGRIYSGKDAQANGLVDSLGEEKEARSAAAQLASLDNPTYILYEDNQDLGSIYGFSLLQILKPELSALKQIKPGIYAYYLMSAQY